MGEHPGQVFLPDTKAIISYGFKTVVLALPADSLPSFYRTRSRLITVSPQLQLTNSFVCYYKWNIHQLDLNAIGNSSTQSPPFIGWLKLSKENESQNVRYSATAHHRIDHVLPSVSYRLPWVPPRLIRASANRMSVREGLFLRVCDL